MALKAERLSDPSLTEPRRRRRKLRFPEFPQVRRSPGLERDRENPELEPKSLLKCVLVGSDAVTIEESRTREVLAAS
jgi:hypothetical protein